MCARRFDLHAPRRGAASGEVVEFRIRHKLQRSIPGGRAKNSRRIPQRIARAIVAAEIPLISGDFIFPVIIFPAGKQVAKPAAIGMKSLLVLGAIVGFLIGAGFGLAASSPWPTTIWRAGAAALAAGVLTRWWGRIWMQGLRDSLEQRRSHRPPPAPAPTPKK